MSSTTNRIRLPLPEPTTTTSCECGCDGGDDCPNGEEGPKRDSPTEIRQPETKGA